MFSPKTLLLFSIFYCKVASSILEEETFPKGHLEPLGNHREPDNTIIDELFEIPSSQVFWEKYVKPSKAVVLRGAAKHSLAFTKWTDEYLKENFGDLEVRLERKNEKSGHIPVGAKGIGRDTIGNFIDHYHQTNAYIVSELPTPLWKDIHVPPCLVCGKMGRRLVEVDLWMSGGGSSSILHKDAFNAINCLYNGTKEWKMIEYKYENMIYKAYEPDREIGGFSRINPQKVDLLKYPKITEVPWSFVTINAGDCLFLPKSYYHQVTSYGTMNVAVAILFSRFDHVNNIDFDGCHDNVSYTPLSDMDMDWKYPGHGNLSMGNPDLEDVRTILEQTMTGQDPKTAMVETFKEMYPEKSEEWLEKKAQHIIETAGMKEKKIVKTEDIQALTRDELRKIALAVEPTDLSNTDFHEYTYVAPEHIQNIVKALIDSEGKMDKNKFIALYKQETFGTERFAKEILSKLSSDVEKSWVTREEIAANLAEALLPFEGNQREQHIPPGDTKPQGNDAYADSDDDEYINTPHQQPQPSRDRIEL